MISSINVEFRTDPPLPVGAKVDVALNSAHLQKYGFVIPVIIQTPAALCAPPLSKPIKSILVMALIDTGASETCISEDLANALGLTSVGFSTRITATGPVTTLDYAVDILFPNSGVRSFENLKIGSCKLPYNHNLPDEQRMENSNFGILIGRDMMARWSVVWNGPASSVTITE